MFGLLATKGCTAFFVVALWAYLTVEVRKRADDLADANEEEGGEGWRHHEEVHGRHQMVLDVQAKLSSIQKRISEVVAGAEHQHIG